MDGERRAAGSAGVSDKLLWHVTYLAGLQSVECDMFCLVTIQGRSGWRNDRERESEREGGTEKGERFFGKGEREGWEGQGSVQGQNQGGSERDRHRSWDSDNRPAAGGPGSSYYANKRSMQRRGWDDHDTLPEWYGLCSSESIF